MVEAGAIGPLVDLLGRGTALAKRWAAAALCAIAELRDRNSVRHLVVDGTSDARVIVAHANALEPLIILLRYGGLRGQEQAAAALAVLWSADVGDVNSVGVEVVLPALVSLLRRGSAAAKGAAATVVCCFAAEDNIVVKEAIIAANAIEPLAALKDDGTPTLVSFDGKSSTFGEEASSALHALGWVAAVWALDRLDADDTDEAARAVLPEIGEEKQAAARGLRAKRRQLSGPWFWRQLEAASSVWPPTRDGASLESLLEKRTVLEAFDEKTECWHTGTLVPSQGPSPTAHGRRMARVQQPLPTSTGGGSTLTSKFVPPELLRPPPPTTHPCPPSRETWLDELTPGSVCEVSLDDDPFRWSPAIVYKRDAPTSDSQGAVHVLAADGTEHSLVGDSQIARIRPRWEYDADSATWSIHRDWQDPPLHPSWERTITADPEKLSSFRWIAGIGFPVSEMDSFEDMIAALPEPAALCQFGAILLRARMDRTACQRLAMAAAAGSAEACWYLACYRCLAAVQHVEASRRRANVVFCIGG